MCRSFLNSWINYITVNIGFYLYFCYWSCQKCLISPTLGLAAHIYGPYSVTWTQHDTSLSCGQTNRVTAPALALWLHSELFDDHRTLWRFTDKETHTRMNDPRDPCAFQQLDHESWGSLSWIMGTGGWSPLQTADMNRLGSLCIIWHKRGLHFYKLHSTPDYILLSSLFIHINLLYTQTFFCCCFHSWEPFSSCIPAQPHEWN